MLLREHPWQQARCLRRAARPRRRKGRQAVLAALELEQVLGQPLVRAEEALGRRVQLDGRRVLGSHARPAADDEPRLALVCEELAVERIHAADVVGEHRAEERPRERAPHAPFALSRHRLECALHRDRQRAGMPGRVRRRALLRSSCSLNQAAVCFDGQLRHRLQPHKAIANRAPQPCTRLGSPSLRAARAAALCPHDVGHQCRRRGKTLCGQCARSRGGLQ